MIEAIAVISVAICSPIIVVLGWLIVRAIRSLDIRNDTQDKAIEKNSDDFVNLKSRVDILSTREELVVKPINRQLQELKYHMVTKELFKVHTDDLKEFKKMFTDHTNAHVGIKDYVDNALKEFKKDLDGNR